MARKAYKLPKWPGTIQNRCFFIAYSKVFCYRSNVCKADYRLFHVVSPSTAKLRCPTAILAHATSRVTVVAKRMVTIGDDGGGYAVVTGTRGNNTADTLPDHKSCLEDHSVTNRQPVQNLEKEVM